MIPAGFDYHAPATIGEATALLSRLGDDAKVLSGGQSLIPLLKLRLASPRHLVDINRIPGLAYVKEADGALRIGALAREVDLDESDVVRARYPLLADATRVIADPLVRNLASHGIGRSLHDDPSEIPTWYERRDRRTIPEGLVFTIEPFLSLGANRVEQRDDGWSLYPPEEQPTVQYEHTLVATKRGPLILTMV